MAEININYNSDALTILGNTINNKSYTVIQRDIPFSESTINKSDWVGKNYVFNNKNVGLLIKKDPLILDSSSLLIENVPVLYSYNNRIERLNGTLSNYSIKFFIYPCIDLSEIVNHSINILSLKNWLNIDNNYNFTSIYSVYPEGANKFIPKETSTKTTLSNIIGSGKECIYNYPGAITEYSVKSAYDIDINSLGINIPSNLERGINEETLAIFNKDNIIEYRDQRLIEYANYISYYYDPSSLILFENDSSNTAYYLLRSGIKDTINLWNTSGSTLYTEKCMFNPFSNLICECAKYYGKSNSYYYNIILTGIKKIEEA